MDLAPLIAFAQRYAKETAAGGPGLPGLSIFQSREETSFDGFVYEPVICLILQGSKITTVGDQTAEVRAGDALLVSHDLPVMSRITRASADAPYLAVILSLDLATVRGLYDQIADLPLPSAPARSLAKDRADAAWLSPLTRYFALMDSPLDARVLGPGILREIHYRLLLSPIGTMLRQLLLADSRASHVARAIRKLRAEFRETLAVPDLARTAGMSASSFHEHFKSVTGTTPLQYQKDLRLIAARDLLAARNHSVSSAAYAVGYESPTHFSRDYSRKFGQPPSREPSLRRDTAPV